MTPALHILSSSQVEDAAQFGRNIRDMAVDGTNEFVRRADVPHLVEAGRDGAAAVVSGVKYRITGRRRRGPSPLVSVGLIAVSLAVGLGAWLLVRSNGLSFLRSTRDNDDDTGDLTIHAETAFDADAHDRATDDGMGMAGPTPNLASVPDLNE